jgi:hypothetical protein
MWALRALAAASFATLLAGCSLLSGDAPPLTPQDCFGDVPYSFVGWTTLAELRPQAGPADLRVYALVTRDEVVLTVSPPAADGSTVSIVGRGVCWTWPGADGVSKAALDRTRQVPNP